MRPKVPHVPAVAARAVVGREAELMTVVEQRATGASAFSRWPMLGDKKRSGSCGVSLPPAAEQRSTGRAEWVKPCSP
jgi:hypothetical protein